jgi:hypothetical protein
MGAGGQQAPDHTVAINAPEHTELARHGARVADLLRLMATRARLCLDSFAAIPVDGDRPCVDALVERVVRAVDVMEGGE